MPLQAEITVEGLTKVNRALREIGKEAQKELKDLGLEAAKPVEATAKNKAPARTGRLRASIRTSGTTKGAVIRGGKSIVPYFGWIDFGGGRRGRGGGLARREFLKRGRILYPAIDEHRAEIIQTYDHGVQQIIRKYDLD